MIFLIISSLLLMKYLLSPNNILTKTVIGLWRKIKGGTGLGIENDKLAELGTKIKDDK